MQLTDIMISYSFAVGQWQASVVLSNGEKERLRGFGSGKCEKEAARAAVYRAIGIVCDPYEGEKENSVIDYTKQLVSELSP